MQVTESSFLRIFEYNESNNDISFLSILVRNLTVLALLSIGGVLSLGFISILISFMIGVELGLASFFIAQMSDWRLILLLLPHGFIELMGMVIAGAIGIKPLFIVYDYLQKDRRPLEEYISKKRFVPTLKLIFLAILFISFAALIESYITGGIILRLLT